MESTEFWCNTDNVQTYITIITLITLWSIPWKALALWRSARHSQKWWFLIFLIVNTAGILEIAYLFLLPKLGKKAK